jgi:hypothetical protein
MNNSAIQLKDEVEQLAATAYFQHLISGYGYGEDPDFYQIVIQGRPKHYSLAEAHMVLAALLANTPTSRPTQPLRQLAVR